MNRGSGLISIWLAFSILILSAGLVSHVMSIPVILGIAGRDSWISVIAAAPFYLIWMLVLYYILKYVKGQRLPDWIQREFGVVSAWIFRLSAAAVLYISGVYTLQDTSMWTVTTYMQQTPTFVIVVSAALIAMLAAYGGLKSIAMTSSVLLPIVILLGYFVMLANTKHKDYSLLLPMLEHGWQPVGSGAFYVLSGLLEVWIILLFQHELKSKVKFWQLALLCLFLTSMAIGPTLGAITEFGPLEAAKQRHTAFEQWKILSIGTLLQHVDFMSIYQWLCGSFARVAISLYLITEMLDVRKPNWRILTLLIVTISMVAVTLQPWRDDQTLLYLQRFHMPGLLFYVAAITLLLAFAVLFKSNRKEKDANDAGSRY